MSAPKYKLYGHVPLQRVWISESFGLEWGIIHRETDQLKQLRVGGYAMGGGGADLWSLV